MVEQFWKQKRPGFESQFGLNVLFWYAEIGTCISETRRKVNIFLQFIKSPENYCHSPASLSLLLLSSVDKNFNLGHNL